MTFLDRAADKTVDIAGLIGRLASLEQKALPFARLIAPVIPYGSTVVEALTLAQPYIDRIALSAPVVVRVIEDGRPILVSIEAQAPKLLAAVKHLYAIAVNADPNMPQSNMQASEVGDEQAKEFVAFAVLGRGWTAEEESRWFDIGKGDVGGIGTGR